MLMPPLLGVSAPECIASPMLESRYATIAPPTSDTAARRLVLQPQSPTPISNHHRRPRSQISSRRIPKESEVAMLTRGQPEVERRGARICQQGNASVSPMCSPRLLKPSPLLASTLPTRLHVVRNEPIWDGSVKLPTSVYSIAGLPLLLNPQHPAAAATTTATLVPSMSGVVTSRRPKSRELTLNTALISSSSSSSTYSSSSGIVDITPKGTAERRLQSTIPNMGLSHPNGLVGLQNIGNTCFMSACVQCLANCPPIIEYFGHAIKAADLNTKNSTRGDIAIAFSNLVQLLRTRPAFTSVSPKMLKQQVSKWAPQFTGTMQQDCQEFLRFLLDGLHEDLNRVRTRVQCSLNIAKSLSDAEQAALNYQATLMQSDSVISDMFCGQLMSVVRCHRCRTKSLKFDPFFDLSLPIPCVSRPPVDIMHCLQKFTENEELDGDNKYRCDKCRKRRTATRSLSISKWPQLLVLHLKRFTVDLWQKLDAPVTFPETELNLSQFTSSTVPQDCEPIFQLVGVCCHYGDMAGGHYIAAAKNPEDGNWYSYNDSVVSKTNFPSIQGSGPYVLFYQRKN